MSAYRYWRILITDYPADIMAPLMEIELHTSVGGADVTGSGTAAASSVYLARTPDSAFDNNTVTGWSPSSSPKPHWIQYDFGAGYAYDIVEFSIKMHSVITNAPTAFALLASNDGQYFTVIDARSGQSWAASETKTFTVTPLVAGTAFQPSAAPVIDANHYWIHSTVDRLGVPGRYPVRLYNRASGALLRESKSDATTGGYQFQFLPYLERGYQVIALDDPATRSDPKNAAIADLMTPEAMP